MMEMRVGRKEVAVKQLSQNRALLRIMRTQNNGILLWLLYVLIKCLFVVSRPWTKTQKLDMDMCV